MVFLIVAAIVMFTISMVLPNYVFRTSIHYFNENRNVIGNITICCINDTYTCNIIVEYVNKSIINNSKVYEVNIILYNSFDNYMRSNNSCNLILGLNEFEFIIAKDKNRLGHIDYFTTYSILNRVPHNDLLFKSFTTAVPYCYTIKRISETKYGNVFEKILGRNRINETVLVKIYRLIVIKDVNEFLENIIKYIVENNKQLYSHNRSKCNSIYNDQELFAINRILTYYDIQYILSYIRGEHK